MKGHLQTGVTLQLSKGSAAHAYTAVQLAVLQTTYRNMGITTGCQAVSLMKHPVGKLVAYTCCSEANLLVYLCRQADPLGSDSDDDEAPATPQAQRGGSNSSAPSEPACLTSDLLTLPLSGCRSCSICTHIARRCYGHLP